MSADCQMVYICCASSQQTAHASRQKLLFQSDSDMSEDFVGVIAENNEENTELFEHFRIVADKGQTLVRVDKFLQNRLENVSRNRVQNAAKAGSILVNDKPVKSNYKVKPFDVVTVVLAYPPREVTIF